MILGDKVPAEPFFDEERGKPGRFKPKAGACNKH
jgi:hypothetical protein